MTSLRVFACMCACALAVIAAVHPAHAESDVPSCKYGMEWNDCGSGCTPTCANPEPICTMQCVPRCECPSAAPMWDKPGRQCIPVSSCPVSEASKRRLEAGEADEELDIPILKEEPEPEPVPSKNRKCQYGVATGPCRARHPRWYYNSKTADCEPFLYGGCKGNTNNFFSKDDCVSECIMNNPPNDPELAGVEL